MACCIFVVAIVAQILEIWRRIRATVGAPITACSRATPEILLAARRLVRTRFGRSIVVLLFGLELATAGNWLYVHHRAHLEHVVENVASTLHLGNDSATATPPICTARQSRFD